jgi:hypothetical protein
MFEKCRPSDAGNFDRIINSMGQSWVSNRLVFHGQSRFKVDCHLFGNRFGLCANVPYILELNDLDYPLQAVC